jgi:hypothetical protein
MALALSALAEIARAAIGEHDGLLQLLAITGTDGGSARVEVVVAVSGCHEGTCQLMVNVSRSSRAELESELRRKLSEQLRDHRWQ